MKLNQKAFSLPELLAVIVLIAVIATITVPIVINVFNDASDDIFKDNAMSLSKAADNYYTALTLQTDTKLPLLVTYENGKETNKYINNENNACETSNTRILEYTGQNPDSGNIYIDRNGDIYMAIYDDQAKKCAMKNPGDKSITLTDKLKSECKLNNNPCETY